MISLGSDTYIHAANENQTGHVAALVLKQNVINNDAVENE